MDLTKEDEEIIKEYKAKNLRKRYYEKNLQKEEDDLRKKLEDLEIEKNIMKDDDYIPLQTEIIEEVKPIKKRLYKSYYICQTCGNKFEALNQLHKHLLIIKGCNVFSDTLSEVDKLISRKLEILELKINSYRMDLETTDRDFSTKKKRLNSMKDSICKIENLIKNHGHLYPENKKELILEFILDYKKDIKLLLLEYYKLLDRSDLFDL